MCIHTYIHIYIYIYIYMYEYAHMRLWQSHELDSNVLRDHNSVMKALYMNKVSFLCVCVCVCLCLCLCCICVCIYICSCQSLGACVVHEECLFEKGELSVRACVYLCIYVFMFVFIYNYVYAYIHTYIQIRLRALEEAHRKQVAELEADIAVLEEQVQVAKRAGVMEGMHVCICIYVYICMHVCVYACIHIHT
jgi:hypothetical protein